jgi:hypothetical protein
MLEDGVLPSGVGIVAMREETRSFSHESGITE